LGDRGKAPADYGNKYYYYICKNPDDRNSFFGKSRFTKFTLPEFFYFLFEFFFLSITAKNILPERKKHADIINILILMGSLNPPVNTIKIPLIKAPPAKRKEIAIKISKNASVFLFIICGRLLRRYFLK